MRPQPGEEIDNSQPQRLRRALRGWLQRAGKHARLASPPRVAAEMLLGTLEARALHQFISGDQASGRERSTLIRELATAVFPDAKA